MGNKNICRTTTKCTGGKTADETGAECKGKFSVSNIFINFTPTAMPFLLQLEYLHSIEI